MVITRVELLEIEFIARSRLPESKVVSVESIKAWNRGIKSLGNNNLATFPVSSFNTTIVVLSDVTIESYLIGDVSAFNFPRVAPAEPVVWCLHLVAINDALLEDTIVISDAVTPSRDF